MTMSLVGTSAPVMSPLGEKVKVVGSYAPDAGTVCSTAALSSWKNGNSNSCWLTR